MDTVRPETESHERLSAPITGFVDYDPQEQYLFNTWMKKTAAVYESFGFTPLYLRPFERLAALQGEGETQKQIFEVFRADTGQSTGLGLPFDRTVPLALWVAEHAGHLQKFSFPFKRYDIGLSYRGERPKMGRFRAFIQADVDIVGKNLSLSADVECIAATISALRSLDVGDFTVRINHIQIVKSILKRHRIPDAQHPAVLRAIDKLDKISPAEVAAELARIPGFHLSAKEVDAMLSSFMQQGSLDGDYGEEALPGLSDLRAVMGMNPDVFVFAPGMVRGLAYYTGTVFETLLVGKEQYGSIAGGGRYSNLVGSFAKGLEDVEGIGISLGLTRLFDVLCKTGMALPQRTTMAQVLVGARTPELMALAYQVGDALRKMGVLVDMYSGVPKVKQILGHASALGTPYAVLIMDEQAIVVKDLGSQKQQEYKTISEVKEFFSGASR